VPGTKIDLKRELHELYVPGREPVLVDVPELPFLAVDGQGDPNTSAAYAEAIEALFSVSYAIKFALKRGPAGLDYAVMPLEGLWWADDTAAFPGDDKASWSWTAMIAQPPEVTEELVGEAVDGVVARRPLVASSRLRLLLFCEGPAAQLLHVGPYSAEGPAIARLHAFIAANGLEPHGTHHEIYLGDPRRSAPEKLRTVLRQPVRPAP
jgi:hypothetical protein